MNILLISVKSECSRGGIATWTNRFLNNCEVHEIFCDVVNTEMVGRRQTGETFHRNLFDEFIRTRRIFSDLKKCLKRVDYDAVHLNTSCGTFGLFRDYFIAKRVKNQNLHLITHYHCDIPYWISNVISRYFLRKLVILSDENLVLCENSRKYLKTTFGADSHKVPNFLDEALIKFDDKQISDELSTAIFVGRVSEAKGARELYALADRFPHIAFRLVGDISSTVQSWEKPQNITLLGGLPHDKVLEELDKADVFVFPSHSEGFSLALTEAMARGLPAIATDVGANADMLAGECGIIADIGDVSAMGKALITMQSPEIRHRMSLNALKKVKNEYCADVILEIFKKHYQL